MTSVTLRSASPAKTTADAVVVGVFSHTKGGTKSLDLAPGAEDVSAAYGRKLRPLLAQLGFEAKAGEILRLPTQQTIKSPLLILVGMGESGEAADTVESVDPTVLRRTAATAYRALRNVSSAVFALPAATAEQVRALVEGLHLGRYSYQEHKSKKTEDDAPGELIVLTEGARRQEFTTAFARAEVVADAVAATRDLVNHPPNRLNPVTFAESVTARRKDLGLDKTVGTGGKLTLTVLDEEQLRAEGYGGVLGVGQASATPPRFVEIAWEPAEASKHVALVGKGVTYDSGGLSIKPGSGMATMKSDMAGAATVVEAALAAARLDLPIRVTAFAPLAENMISGTAYRPGDVLELLDGTTVEVQNTDAEGRLLLADGLVRAQRLEPDLILDVATLTGAMVVALGEQVAGVMGSESAVAAVVSAAESAGEMVWPMPIPEEMTERVRSSKVADLAQIDWVRWGGGLYAAAFLREFTGERTWAHLDIAGPSFNEGGPRGHISSGGTGFGVATLVDLLEEMARS